MSHHKSSLALFALRRSGFKLPNILRPSSNTRGRSAATKEDILKTVKGYLMSRVVVDHHHRGVYDVAEEDEDKCFYAACCHEGNDCIRVCGPENLKVPNCFRHIPRCDLCQNPAFAVDLNNHVACAAHASILTGATAKQLKAFQQEAEDDLHSTFLEKYEEDEEDVWHPECDFAPDMKNNGDVASALIYGHISWKKVKEQQTQVHCFRCKMLDAVGECITDANGFVCKKCQNIENHKCRTCDRLMHKVWCGNVGSFFKCRFHG